MATEQKNIKWPPERADRVRRYWSEDGLSASQIGELMGCSRNAIIGLVHRNGFKKPSLGEIRSQNAKAQPKGDDKKFIPKKKARSKPNPPPKFLIPRNKPMMPVCEPVNAITFWKLKPWSCRWPIGDPPLNTLRFCGKSVEKGRSYCPSHCDMAYQPSVNHASRRSKAA
jgi:GcrA cell cycle regulator